MAKSHIERLTELIHPPTKPVNGYASNSLINACGSIPFRFPDDFLEYSRLYGTGQIIFGSYSVSVANVYDPNYPKWIEAEVEDFVSNDPDEILQHPYAPSVERTVPCIRSASGFVLYMSHDCNNFVMVDMPYAEPESAFVYSLSCSEFLLQLVTGELNREWGYPNEDIRGSEVSFYPVDWLSKAI